MTAPITQRDVYYDACNHLRLIEPLLERIGSGSGTQVGAGYVEVDIERNEYLTDLGWSTVEALKTVALDSTAHLWDVSNCVTEHVDTRPVSDVQGFLAVLARALGGMESKDAPPACVGVSPPWVATCLLNMLCALLKRVEEESALFDLIHSAGGRMPEEVDQ